MDKPVKMSAIGHTTEFPRKDNVFKKKESLPFDEAQSIVWKDRVVQGNEKFYEWMAFIICGVLTGFTAFLMDKLEGFLISLAYNNAQAQIGTDQITKEVVPPWLIYAGISGFYGLVASIMTTYWGTGAAGSGVAELIGYLNGVNYPDFIGIPTLVTKVIGVTLAVSGKLCVGKEGPLAHIGANMGALVLYIFPQFEFMRNDELRRIIIAAGGSAGVSVAFGAPIGGALFSYELSKPNTFWKFEMLWKVFMCCCMAVFTAGLCDAILDGDLTDWTDMALKFGQISLKGNLNIFQVMIGAVVLGVVGGCLGAFFISVNTKCNAIRAQLLTQKWMKPIETFGFSFVTATVFFFATYLTYTQKWCVPYQKEEDTDDYRYYAGWCDSGYYDPMASILFASEGGIIRNIMSEKISLDFIQISIVLGVWYLFTIITYGTNVPAGLFLPGMIIGCAVGQVYAVFIHDLHLISDDEFADCQKAFVVLGVGAVMAGYTRMTYTLAIIVMETSMIISLFIPTAFAILISNIVGYWFTRSLYERAVRGKQMPILIDSVPESEKFIIADKIMNRDVVSLKNVETVENIRSALKSGHHGFPVLNQNGKAVGVIPRNFLIVILQNKAFYKGKPVGGDSIREEQEVDGVKESLIPGINSELRTTGMGERGEGLERKQTYVDFTSFFDNDAYPPTPDNQILSWKYFTRDFLAKDLPVELVDGTLGSFNDELVDLRPYMIENPFTVFTTDQLGKCVDVFRKMHLRHLVVVHPGDCSLRGIITRKDLFKHLDL